MKIKTQPQRIAVIGNACAGKTRLSLLLAEKYNLPLVHVDQYQFLEGLKLRPYKETIDILNQKQNEEQWIIDGFGPLDILEDRLKLADVIIMLDWPISSNYYWAVKRTIKNIWQGQRPELPKHSSERSISHIFKLFKTIKQIHTKMRPEMLRILDGPIHQQKTIIVQNFKDLSQIYKRIEICNN